MTEQATGRDPRTGKKLPHKPSSDSTQNDNYVNPSHPQETARDYSRPHTIPPEEWAETHFQPYEDAVALFQMHEDQRKADEALENVIHA